MASLGGPRGGGRSLSLVVWLLLLRPGPREARAGGEGAQGGSALPSGGGRRAPGVSLWKSPPVGVPASSGAPGSYEVDFDVVDFLPGD